MIKLSICFFIFWSSGLFANDFYYKTSHQQRKVYVYSVAGVNIADISSCHKKKCDAYKAVIGADKEVLQKQIIVLPGGMNPSSAMCHALNGKPWFLFDKEKNQVSFCFFTDGSFFEAWQLFNKLFLK